MAIKNNIAENPIQSQRSSFQWLIIICIIFFELLAYICVRTESTQTIFRISRANEALINKSSYRKALNVERDRLKSDDRITRIAKTRLNLSTCTLNQTIYLPGE